MPADDTIVWQARCIICGWLSAYGPLDNVHEEAAAHVRQEHAQSGELHTWLEGEYQRGLMAQEWFDSYTESSPGAEGVWHATQELRSP